MTRSLTHTRLRQVLNYNPKTGVFRWRINKRGHARKGNRAGTITASGYRQIKLDQECFSAGPLAIFWMTGRWPKVIADHINMVRDENRWSNLREATHSQNHANS